MNIKRIKLNLNIILIIFKYLLIFFLLLIIYFKNLNITINEENKLTKNDIKNTEKFYKICNYGILLNIRNFTKIKNPKISIITPIYNKEKYILRYLRGIQNQFFDDIEIILIDDFSTDKSPYIIKKYKKEDERIILIKHKINKGTLISRNEGILKSKGKYLIFLDPDDLLSSNILFFCYNMTLKYDYNLIRFNIYEGYGKIVLDILDNNHLNKTIFQPELSLYLFYGLGRLEELDYFITNKFIKRDIVVKALNLIDYYYLNQFMIDCEDGLINFILYRISNSYIFFRKIGYYYIKNEQSITKENGDNFLKRLKSNFLYLKFIFQYTKNNIIEKNISNYIFSEIYSAHKDVFINLFNQVFDFRFYNEIINLYLNCEFISLETKEILNNITIIIDKNKSIHQF